MFVPPLPLNGLMETTHGFVFTTFHAQPSGIESATLPTSAAAVCVSEFGTMSGVQGAPLCVMTANASLTVMTAVREAEDGFSGIV